MEKAMYKKQSSDGRLKNHTSSISEKKIEKQNKETC